MTMDKANLLGSTAHGGIAGAANTVGRRPPERPPDFRGT
jgi:hypothetical protein